MSKRSREELVMQIYPHHLRVSKAEKSRILDEFTRTTEHHRKHTIRLLKHGFETTRPEGHAGKPTYTGETARQWDKAWEVTGRICGR